MAAIRLFTEVAVRPTAATYGARRSLLINSHVLDTFLESGPESESDLEFD